MSDPFYVEVYKSGNQSKVPYAPGSSSDWAAKNGYKKAFLAYRIKVTPKPGMIFTSDCAIDTEKARSAINGGKSYAWVEACEPLPPVSHQILKAFGAFGILILTCLFLTWFALELFPS